MTLKNETERLENSSNKIKTIKTNINKELVAKGSTNVKTLADIPLKIKNLKSGSNYAEGTCNIQVDKILTSHTIPLNLEFVPKIVFLKIKSADGEIIVNGDNNLTFLTKKANIFCIFQSISYSKSEIEFKIKHEINSRKKVYTVSGWIALG